LPGLANVTTLWLPLNTTVENIIAQWSPVFFDTSSQNNGSMGNYLRGKISWTNAITNSWIRPECLISFVNSDQCTLTLSCHLGHSFRTGIPTSFDSQWHEHF